MSNGMYKDYMNLRRVAEKLDMSYENLCLLIRKGRFPIDVYDAPADGFRGRTPRVCYSDDVYDLIEATARGISIEKLREEREEEGRKVAIVKKINNLEEGISTMLEYLIMLDNQVRELKDLL